MVYIPLESSKLNRPIVLVGSAGSGKALLEGELLKDKNFNFMIVIK